jgi:hypothetical protein
MRRSFDRLATFLRLAWMRDYGQQVRAVDHAVAVSCRCLTV